MTMYDKTFKGILNIDGISQVKPSYNYLYNNLRKIRYKSMIYIKIKTLFVFRFRFYCENITQQGVRTTKNHHKRTGTGGYEKRNWTKREKHWAWSGYGAVYGSNPWVKTFFFLISFTEHVFSFFLSHSTLFFSLNHQKIHRYS